MSVIKFNPPDDNAPGYLRMVRVAVGFSEKLGAEPKQKTIDELVEFLLPFVEEPVDRDQAREALWDASKVQFQQLLKAVTGADESNPT
jgi:hypothetical protein